MFIFLVNFDLNELRAFLSRWSIVPVRDRQPFEGQEGSVNRFDRFYRQIRRIAL